MPAKYAISISLTEHLASFIKTEIASGRYGTASEVVRAGLRLLQERTPGRAIADNSGDAASLKRKQRARARERALLAEKS
jgi:antitoxin ParD1/3/4